MNNILQEISNYRNNFNITKNYIPEHIENKTLQLFVEYNDSKILGNDSVISNFLHSLYYVDSGTNAVSNFKDISQVKRYFRQNPHAVLESKKYFEIVILYLRTHIDFHKENNYFNDCIKIVESLNLIYQFHKIPFKIILTPMKRDGQMFTKKSRRNSIVDFDIRIEPVFSEIEEENKNKIKQFIENNKYDKVNEHLNKSYTAFVNNDYTSSIRESYLVLEKALKELVGNHQIDVVKLFPEYQKQYLDDNNGIFSISEIKGKIKSQINMIYAFRSKLESHSDTETFDRSLNLYEIARFQLNEVINLSILLMELAGK